MRLIYLILLSTLSFPKLANSQTTATDPDETCLTGTVLNVGTDFSQITILLLDNGEKTHITGSMKTKIKMLSGALVNVCGEFMTSVDVLEARSFELRKVDGMTAYLGVLQKFDNNWQLKLEGNSDPVPLDDVSELLGRSEGFLVWVAGDWKEKTFSVKSFGLMNSAIQKIPPVYQCREGDSNPQGPKPAGF